MFWTKVNGLFLFYLNGPKVFSSTSEKVNLFAEIFSESCNFNYSGSSLSTPAYLCRTNLILHNISATSKMNKKILMASSPDIIPVVVLKISET